MNNCYYKIEIYSYKPSNNSLDKRIEKFSAKLKAWTNKNDPNKKKYPSWMRVDFFNYWTALDNDMGTKMKFEKQKSWNTGLRLNTWKKNSERDPRWKTQVEYSPPQKSNNNYAKIDYHKAQERFKNQENKGGSIGSIIRDRLNG